MNDTRYIDPETGKLRDSKRSEFVGGAVGGLAGSLAINALGEYGTFKEGLTEQAQIPEMLKDIEGVIEKDKLDLEMADLARAYQTNPSVLDQYPEGARDIIRRDIELMGRLHEREKWDRFNELPLQERLDMFVKGKPSLDGFDANVADELTSIYGPQPLHPEVSGLLRDEIAHNQQNMDELRSLMTEKVRYDWRRAAPSLDHYKPRNLFRTISNPYVTTGLFTGALAGTAFDEYQKHKAFIEQREAGKLEKAAALKLPKLKLPKPKGAEMPKKEPLIPKKVKRVGILAGTAGAAGYTGIKGIQHYQDGAAYAERIQDGGMAAKSPDQLRKERERMMKGAQETNQEGMDLHMKTAYEKYLELEKEAGVGNIVDKVKKTVSDASGKQVKKWEGAVENAKAKGMGEKGLRPTEKKLEQAVADQSKARKQVGIAAGAGAAGIGGTAAAARALANGDEEKIAAVVEDGQPQQGAPLIGKGTKIGAGLGAGVMGTTGALMGSYDGPVGAVGGGIQGAIGGALGGALLGTGAELALRLNRELANRQAQQKTAYETYCELEKVAGVPGMAALKKGMNHLTGKNVKFQQGLLEDAVKRGDGADALQTIQQNVGNAKKSRDIARTATGAGVAAGAAATAGGVMAAKSNQQEKIAADVSVEDSQYAIDHPFKKTIKDFAGYGAGVGAGLGSLSGLIGGGVSGGVPGAALGALGGAAAGGAMGGGLGALGGINSGIYRHVANESLADGNSGMTAGALTGAGLGGGISLAQGLGSRLSAPAVVGGTLYGSVVGGGLGAMIGQNQEKHVNNVENGAFVSNRQLERREAKGQQKVARDISVEDSQYAVDHPYQKTIKDFVLPTAGIGAGIGGLSGLAGGAAASGVPGAIGGLIGGGLVGGLGGASLGGAAGLQHGVSRVVAQKAIDDDKSGMNYGALAGAGLGVGSALAGHATRNAVGRRLSKVEGLDDMAMLAKSNPVADVVSGGLTGGVIGGLLGRNQQKHNDNVAQADDAIDKAAEEVINELFKEAAAVIQDAPMEKVAGVTSPISKIDGTLFGYDRLK